MRRGGSQALARRPRHGSPPMHPGPGRGALALASLSPGNLLEVARAFLFGLRDSLFGLVHVFRLDARAERRRARRALQMEAK